jgi:hypothetical protein
MHRLPYVVSVLILFHVAAAPPVRAQESVTLGASKDNTLFEHPDGALSNGAGKHLFAGTTNTGTKRRALLAFDVSAIPNGARIESASVTLNMSRTISGPHSVRLHRVTSDWGEGASAALGEEGGGAPAAEGDATWLHTAYETELWQMPGGDFESGASTILSITGLGSYTWNTGGLAADVQHWIDEPGTNFGWILIGNESANASAKRFDSREHPTAANRPSLTITYSTSTAAAGSLLPETVRLGANYPEPALGSTTIPLELDAPRHIVVELYDLLGRRHRTLADETLPAGHHRIEVSTDGLAAGVYLYCGASGTACHRLVVIR